MYLASTDLVAQLLSVTNFVLLSKRFPTWVADLNSQDGQGSIPAFTLLQCPIVFAFTAGSWAPGFRL